MATVSFTKTSTGYIATVAGQITNSTTKLINSYTKAHNINLEATVYPKTFGYEPSYKKK